MQQPNFIVPYWDPLCLRQRETQILGESSGNMSTACMMANRSYINDGMQGLMMHGGTVVTPFENMVHLQMPTIATVPVVSTSLPKVKRRSNNQKEVPRLLEAIDANNFENPLQGQTVKKPKRRNRKKEIPRHPCPVCKKLLSTPAEVKVHMRVHTGERPYKCPECDKAFKKSSHLLYHKRTHTGEKAHQCPECQKCLTTAYHLSEHMRIHSGEKPYSCDICQKSFQSKAYAIIHRRIHTGEKPYKCQVCDKSFAQLSTLRTHLRVHRREHYEKQFACSVCMKTFSYEVELKRHLNKHNEEALASNNRSDQNISNIEQPANDTTSVKEIAKPVLVVPVGGFFSNRMSENQQQPLPNTVIASNVAAAYLSTNTLSVVPMNTVLQTSVLNLPSSALLATQVAAVTGAFADNAVMKSQVVTHPINIPHVAVADGFASTSGLQFTNGMNGGLVSQTVAVPPPPPPPQNKNDKQSQPSKTSSNRRYSCPVCNKLLTGGPAEVKRHMRVHTGERPYQCPHCDKAFKKSSHLLYHKRTHTGEKPHQCHQCSKCFAKPNHLNEHLRTHSGEKPFSCDICQKSFHSKAYVLIHRRIHTGEKPYKCPVCEKSFVQPSGLRIHKLVHARSTAERRFSCPICQKLFLRPFEVKSHMRRHRHAGQLLIPESTS